MTDYPTTNGLMKTQGVEYKPGKSLTIEDIKPAIEFLESELISLEKVLNCFKGVIIRRQQEQTSISLPLLQDIYAELKGNRKATRALIADIAILLSRLERGA